MDGACENCNVVVCRRWVGVEITAVRGSFRAEHSTGTRVLFPATRRKHVVADWQRANLPGIFFKRKGAEENREVRREYFPLRRSTLLLCASAF